MLTSNHDLCELLLSQGISISTVEAFQKVDRKLFVPAANSSRAYLNIPLPIGLNQTISQPYIVGLMTDSLRLTGIEKVFEIGTGSGYQTAVLSHLSSEIVSTEIVPEHFKRSEQLFRKLELNNITCFQGDADQILDDLGTFDRIIVTCAMPFMPDNFSQHLTKDGIIVAPVDSWPGCQALNRYVKTENHIEKEKIEDVVFVPMTGKIREG